MKKHYRDIDGILLVDKPPEASSNQVLQQVRRGYNARKAGHTGTLDPFASGLLVCCFGQATKISGMLLDGDKTYRATLQLGQATATGDREGEVTAEADVPALDPAHIQSLFDAMQGPQAQTPPMYSAIKVDGKRLYKLARQGIEVERQPRQITIHRLQLLDCKADSIEFEVRCSKGTYVRVLGETIATELGSCGHLSALRRTGLGPFTVAAAQTPEQLEQGDWPQAVLLSPDQALVAWPAVELDPAATADFVHGRRPRLPAASAASPLRVYDAEHRFLGIGELAEDGLLKPKRLFITTNKG
ncbi:MAG: tRNA pseudouridine(55) synthase TruB [Wenzhouxiangellaceae bacterium]